MRAGWVIVALGVGSAAVFQHLDAYLFASVLIVTGLLLLRVKGV